MQGCKDLMACGNITLIVVYEDERYPSNVGDLSTATERYVLKDLSPSSAIGVEFIPWKV